VLHVSAVCTLTLLLFCTRLSQLHLCDFSLHYYICKCETDEVVRVTMTDDDIAISNIHFHSV